MDPHAMNLSARTKSRLARISVIATLVALPLAASACSSSSGSSTATTSGAGSSSTASTSTTAASTASSHSCSSVTAAMVNAALGTSVGDPTTTLNGPVTVCTYKSSTGQVIVRFQSGTTPASFESAKSQFTAHGEPVTTVTGLGDEAYSSTIGTGSEAINSIVVLKGSEELLITGPASLSQVQAFATQLLATL